MHGQFLNRTSSSERVLKVNNNLAETQSLSSLFALNGAVSTGSPTQIHCECLDELSAYAAASPVVSEPNCCGTPLGWFDASERRRQIEKAFTVSDLSCRAELVQKYQIMARCTCSRILIESVANASMTGVLVQSHLAGPLRSTPQILKKLVRENKRKYATAQMPKRKPARVRRGLSLIDTLTIPTLAADTEKA
ncbi:hypothetical protein [Methylobacterium sp. Leaf89]|uniref:hypothetical protein n=1 Tax=Methylobacterium sp. Leaf89 TaxID=1736245 RepID=UPI000AF4C9E9|nr:hypothetical protein [Methylobacterium sp. Leaf89]